MNFDCQFSTSINKISSIRFRYKFAFVLLFIYLYSSDAVFMLMSAFSSTTDSASNHVYEIVNFSLLTVRLANNQMNVCMRMGTVELHLLWNGFEFIRIVFDFSFPRRFP